MKARYVILLSVMAGFFLGILYEDVSLHRVR